MKNLILNSITIEAFGVFKNRQTISLATEKDDRPIILIEGMNGCGKTTFLQALELGLYGERLFHDKKSKYARFISELARTDVLQSPAIDLDLDLENQGKKERYLVSRRWNQTKASFSETFAVYRDGRRLDFDAAQWSEIIDEYLPVGLHELFFFDGEKIEAMANPEKIPGILNKALESLLGLGVIDVLRVDLEAYERRSLTRMKGQKSEADANLLAGYLKNLEELEARAEKLSIQRASIVNQLDSAREELSEIKNRANMQGLNAFKSVVALKEQISGLEKQEQDLEEYRQKIIGDPFYPLIKGESLAKELINKLKEEKQYIANEEILKEILAHAETLKLLLVKALPDDEEAIKGIFSDHESGLEKYTNKTAQLKPLEPAAIESRVAFLKSSLNHTNSNISRVNDSAARLKLKISEAPSDEKVALLMASVKEKEIAVSLLESRLKETDTAVGQCSDAQNQLKNKIEQTKETLRLYFKEAEIEKYKLSAARRVQGVLGEFKRKLIVQKAEWLSKTITDYFKELSRKENFISRITVDPDTYKIELALTSGEIVPMGRLSAGERQMLATALLKTLMSGKNSGLPVIVDTPLARLDGKHRLNLVQNFYTKVSQQVVILSTDEEIFGDLKDELMKNVKRTYRLIFSDKDRATTVEVVK